MIVHVSLWVYFLSACMHVLIFHQRFWVSSRSRGKGDHWSVTPCEALSRWAKETENDWMKMCTFLGSPVTQATCEDLPRDIAGAGASARMPSARTLQWRASSGHAQGLGTGMEASESGPSWHAVVTFHKRVWSRELVIWFWFNVLPLAVLGRIEWDKAAREGFVGGRENNGQIQIYI